MKDKSGREYLLLQNAKAGQEVELDSGFTCREAGKHVLLGDNGELYFHCRDGRHYIEGQADDGMHCVGIYPV